MAVSAVREGMCDFAADRAASVDYSLGCRALQRCPRARRKFPSIFRSLPPRPLASHENDVTLIIPAMFAIAPSSELSRRFGSHELLSHAEQLRHASSSRGATRSSTNEGRRLILEQELEHGLTCTVYGALLVAVG